MESAKTRLAHYNELPNCRIRLDDAATAPAESHDSSHPLGPSGFDFAQHRQTLRSSEDAIVDFVDFVDFDLIDRIVGVSTYHLQARIRSALLNHEERAPPAVVQGAAPDSE